MPDIAPEASPRLSRGAHFWRFAAAGFALALALAYLAGGLRPVDRLIGDLRFSLMSREAARDLVLVEIDTHSLRKLDRWPWPRAYHAALIQRLMQAGARTIAIDVDFSAQSTAANDAALAQAIAAAKGAVALAAFVQPNAYPGKPALSTNLPLPIFREHARIGLVNIIADQDGEPREYRLQEDRLGDGLTTLAALLAESRVPARNAFAIDYSIDPASIARLSYVDVLTGKFDAAAVAGKTVLIGATALELGDRFAVPKHGILSGVEIQALAYSSLVLGRAIHPVAPGWVLAGLAVLVLGFWFGERSPRWCYAAALAASATVILLGLVLQAGFAISLDTAPWLIAIAGGALMRLVGSARRHARAAARHRLAALRQKALMEGVFKDSSEGILIAAEGGRIEIANGAAGRLLETTPSALVGRGIDSVLPGFSPAQAPPFSEMAVALPGGRALDLAVTLTRSQPAVDARNVWIVTFRDESARRAMELARDATIRELQAATAAKNEFLARVSHELRTPLSAIIGFSTIIGDQRMGPVGNAKYVEYARDIHSGGKRLLELVNDIIDIVRIEAEQYEIRPDVFEVRSLLAGSCIAVREAESCGDRTVRFEIADGAEAVLSDRVALAKVIAKLLSNAVKFTGPEGKIVLRAGTGPEQAIVFEIVDDGIGISPAALKQVTAAFSQVGGGLDRRHEGSGLGLYLAHRLMLLLGGVLEIESMPGAGTSVRLTIPEALVRTSQAA